MGDWGVGFLGGVFSFGGGEGRGVFWGFCVFIDYSIGWDFSLGGFFFSFSFPFGSGGFFVLFSFSFSFSAFSLFLMKLRLPPP